MRVDPQGVRFADRRAAGRALAAELGAFAGRKDVVVLGLPRGGIPVAAEVATRLGLPLDACVVRKLGVPGREELAMGAIASGGIVELDRALVDELGITQAQVREVIRCEREELERRERAFRGGRPPLELRGRTVLLVDDGLATGASMRAAVDALRRQAPARIVVAVPVGSRQACALLAQVADECIALSQPEPFVAVGLWYEDFLATSDEEVSECLARNAAGREVQA